MFSGRRIYLLLVFAIGLVSSESDSCTIVKNVKVVSGGTAELHCQINHERNDPSKTTHYRKIWAIKTLGKSMQVYVYLISGGGKVKDGHGDSQYKGRVSREDINVVELRNVTQQDGGTYTCSWEVEPGIAGCLDAIAMFTVTIIDPVSNVEVEVTSPKNETESATFRCSASGTSPITYSWHKVGGVIAADRWTNNSNGSATLSDIQQSDAGEYRCTVDNDANQAQTSEAANLEVYYKPSAISLSSSPSSLTQKENTVVKLTCTAHGGHPAPVVVIHRRALKIAQGITSVNLQMKLHRSDHQVAYVCIATGGGIIGEMKSNEIKYNIMFPHDVAISASPNPVVERRDTTLTCQPRGGNPATVQSYEWQGPFPVTTTSSVIGSSQQLTLTDSSYKHAGKYICSVTNMGGTGSGSIDLKVLYSAKLDPRVTHKHTIPAEYNQNVTFTLRVIAYPPPSFEWFRSHDNMTKLPLLKKSTVNSNGLTSNLTIPMTQKEDMISYICQVKNSVGHREFTFILSPNAPPGQPTEFGIHYKSAVSVTLTWISGFNGGFPQLFALMYRIAGQSWPHHPQITGIPDPGENRAVVYKVQYLAEDTAYEFRVRAENERQSGQRTSKYTAIERGKTKDKPTVAGNKLTILRNAKSTIAIATWPEPRGYYTDIKISYCEKPFGACHEHVVNTSVSTSRTEIRNLDADKTYTYMLRLYDRGDVVYSIGAIVPPMDNRDSVIHGLTALVVIMVIFIVVLSAVVMVMSRRKHSCMFNKPEENNKSEDQNVYQNEAFDGAVLEQKCGSGVIYENVRVMNTSSPLVSAQNKKRKYPTPDGADNCSSGVYGNVPHGDLTYEQLQRPEQVYENSVQSGLQPSNGHTYQSLFQKT